MPAEVRFDVEVEQFRPLGLMNTTIRMTEGTANAKTIAELVGSYYIKVKKKPTNHPEDTNPDVLLLTFVLTDKKHLFSGVVFSKRKAKPNDPPLPANDTNFRGKAAFPEFKITTTGAGFSQMIITNTRDQKASFDYSIIIQEISSGEIGCIDPEIENEV